VRLADVCASRGRQHPAIGSTLSPRWFDWISLDFSEATRLLCARLACVVKRRGVRFLLITAVPLILFCLIAQVPATAAALMQVPDMSQGAQRHVSTDQRLLRVTGEFTPGIVETVEKSLAAARSVRILVFENPGRDVEEAMRVGRDIREHGLTPGVSKECFSACTYSFVAGRQRILHPSGKLGFHACQKVVWYFPL
jgi:hypothetical protein